LPLDGGGDIVVYKWEYREQNPKKGIYRNPETPFRDSKVENLKMKNWRSPINTTKYPRRDPGKRGIIYSAQDENKKKYLHI